jgi:long-chain acyl-CoA synthetase
VRASRQASGSAGWPEIQANAACAAGGFAALGIGEDDSVALMLRNDSRPFEANMAAGQLGAYAVPINWHFTADEAGYILSDCAAKALVIHADLLPQVAAGVPAGTRVLVVPTRRRSATPTGCRPRSGQRRQAARPGIAFIARSEPNTTPPKASRGSMIYTSGTTGRPKGVKREPSTPEQQAKGAVEIGKHWGLIADPSSW